MCSMATAAAVHAGWRNRGGDGRLPASTCSTATFPIGSCAMTATPTAPCWTATPRRRRQPSLLRRARPVAPRMAASPAYPRSVLSAAAAFPATPCWAAAASPMSPMGASVAPRAAPVGFPSSQARLSHCPPPGKQTHRVTVLEQIPRGSRVVRAVCRDVGWRSSCLPQRAVRDADGAARGAPPAASATRGVGLAMLLVVTPTLVYTSIEQISLTFSP